MLNPDEGCVSNLERIKSIVFLSNVPWKREDGVFGQSAIVVNTTAEMSKELLRQHISNVTGGTYVEGNVTHSNAYWIVGDETLGKLAAAGVTFPGNEEFKSKSNDIPHR